MVKLRDDAEFFLINGETAPVDIFPFHLFEKYTSVYEVVKFKGTFHYLDKHLKRLERSLFIAFPSRDYFCRIDEKSLRKLVETNKIDQGNIRIEVFPELETTLLFFIPHFYPPAEYYEKGVDAVFQYDRRPVQNAKIYNAAVRDRANALIKEYGVFETVLVNMKGELTEGSRTNIFLIKGDEVFTPPDNMVLPGITRENMINFLKTKGIVLKYRKIKTKEIGDYNALFFTGTSIGALPCRKLENVYFDMKNPLLRKIIDDFSQQNPS